MIRTIRLFKYEGTYQVDASEGNSNVFGLASGEPTSEMRVTKETGIFRSVHVSHERTVVGVLTERRVLDLAVSAVTLCEKRSRRKSIDETTYQGYFENIRKQLGRKQQLAKQKRCKVNIRIKMQWKSI